MIQAVQGADHALPVEASYCSGNKRVSSAVRTTSSLIHPSRKYFGAFSNTAPNRLHERLHVFRSHHLERHGRRTSFQTSLLILVLPLLFRANRMSVSVVFTVFQPLFWSLSMLLGVEFGGPCTSPQVFRHSEVVWTPTTTTTTTTTTTIQVMRSGHFLHG